MNDHLVDGFLERLAHIFGLDRDFFRLFSEHILARDDHVALAPIFERKDGTDLDLDDLCRTLTDLDAQEIAQMHSDSFIEAIACQTKRRGRNDAAERDDCHFGGATADIDDHRTRGFGNGQIGTHRSSHGLFDEVCLTCTCLDGGLEHRALLDRGRTARDAYDDARGLGRQG